MADDLDRESDNVLAELCATPVDITLVDKRGNKHVYKAHPLDLADLSALERNAVKWAKDRARERIASLAEFMEIGDGIRAQVINQCHENIDTGIALSRYMNSFEGGLEIMALCFKPNHPNVTADILANQATFPSRQAAREVLDVLNGFAFPKAKAGTEKNPKTHPHKNGARADGESTGAPSSRSSPARGSNTRQRKSRP